MEVVTYWKLIVLFITAGNVEVVTTDLYTKDACDKAAAWIVTVSSGEGGFDGDVITNCIEDVPVDLEYE